MVANRQRESQSDTRGQALSLEGIVAGLILLAAVGFALQVTAVTPLSPSTSSQHVENQLYSSGEGMMDGAGANGALEEAVLYWDSDQERFHGTDLAPFYRGTAPENSFGDALDETFGANIAYNVFVHYETGSDSVATQRIVEQGEPSDHAISVSRTVPLFESSRLVEEDGSRGERLEDVGGNFYAPNANANGGLYNVVEVEVVAWRI